MTTVIPRLPAVVAASPAAVAAHDKQLWLSLWASNHIIEDPVGSRPVRGGVYDRRAGDPTRTPLSRFWDTFIATNDIVFEVHADFVSENRIVRDVTIRTTLPSGVKAETPAHLVYELIDEDGEVKIRRMAAHWEVAPVFAQLVKPTVPHVKAMMSSNARMLRYLGPGATTRFVGAVHSIGTPGKCVVARLVKRAGDGDPASLAFLGGAVPENLTKLISSGDTVTATCTVDGEPAVLIASLNRKTKRIVDVEVFTRHIPSSPDRP